ncbi:MAG TPA: hypothetical protein VK550_23730, partial [Polyangiaceae bacterium]|nr:hypothetical protein [Polyangiaceae bacterium]
SSRDIERRFQSAKELSDTLAAALGLTTVSTVAAAPPGFRETALSDYSLSMSANEGVVEHHAGNPLWPSTKTGKLLGAGVLGVTLIVASMSYQKSRNAEKDGQGLVTPAGPVVTAAATSEPMALPTPAAIALPAAAPSVEPAAGQAGRATREPAPKLDRKEAASRRGMLPKDLPKDLPSALPPPRAVEPPPTKAPPAPTKPKDVDFGI